MPDTCYNSLSIKVKTHIWKFDHMQINKSNILKYYYFLKSKKTLYFTRMRKICAMKTNLKSIYLTIKLFIIECPYCQ